jgi:hypothetical protein
VAPARFLLVPASVMAAEPPVSSAIIPMLLPGNPTLDVCWFGHHLMKCQIALVSRQTSQAGGWFQPSWRVRMESFGKPPVPTACTRGGRVKPGAPAGSDE